MTKYLFDANGHVQGREASRCNFLLLVFNLEVVMDIKKFAQKINGFEYPARELNKIQNEAKENGFLVLYGMSDDLLEMRGLIDDEIGAFNGLKTKVGTAGINVEAVWCPEDKPFTSWEIKADCPHETFTIMEDGDVFCIGAVIHEDHLNT